MDSGPGAARRPGMTSMPAIKPDRLLGDLYKLRTFGTFKTGVHRPTFSADDIASRAWFAEQCTAAGLETTIDGIGNILGKSPARRRKALSGSHLEYGFASSGPANGRCRRPSSSATKRSRRSCWSAAQTPAGRRAPMRLAGPRSTRRRAPAIARWSSSCSTTAPIPVHTSMPREMPPRLPERASCGHCSCHAAASSTATTSSGWAKTTKWCGGSPPIRGLRMPVAAACSPLRHAGKRDLRGATA